VDENSGLSSKRLWQIFLEVWDMDDDYLMEEVLNTEYEVYAEINNIVANYMIRGKITKEERERLIGYYILNWHDEEEED
jgi:hypothetical protein